MFGIDSIKSALATLGNFAADVEKKSENGLNLLEVFSLGTVHAIPVYNTFASWTQIKDEYSDLTPEERAEIIDWFSGQFDLQNDRAEAIVEKILHTLSSFDEVRLLITKKA